MNKVKENLCNNQLQAFGVKNGDLPELLQHLEDFLDIGNSEELYSLMYMYCTASEVYDETDLLKRTSLFSTYEQTVKLVKLLGFYRPLIESLLLAEKSK